jgi:predicted RNA-binding protein associated with RNAse of E/G family
MATPVNLNRVRKQMARASKTARAVANVAKFGQTKAQKQRVQHVEKTNSDRLDGHKLDRKN